ncbi:hypothetical protein CLV56_2486 [Mumia flava]|uniref:Uncharacterized protein n=1 Tax=Mumia flava TaxID=1348852 RepID=A0A0B2BEE6_9ACTN|nr:hypothetical protein [Mumia flava]PJJ58239.1 hypothetical protein CLV56_2486 [Mumia flava]
MTETTRTISPDRWGLLRGGEGLMTGTVVSAAVIAATAGHVDSVGQLSLAIVGTTLVYWLAHLHASTIGAAVRSHLHPLSALRTAVAHTWTIAAASLLPLAVLLLANAFGAGLVAASWVALAATVALLALYSYLAGRRGGLGIRDSLACALAGCALGLAAAALKAALH